MQVWMGRIRGLREDNDLTQEDIAKVLGTSQTMYARYERGANELPIRHLITLCKFYNVSADYFLETCPDLRRKIKKRHTARRRTTDTFPLCKNMIYYPFLHIPKEYIIARSAISYRRYITRSEQERISLRHTS